MKMKFSFIIILIFLSACEKTSDTSEILKFYGDAKEDIGYSVALASDGYYIGGQLSVITHSGVQIVSFSKKPSIIKTGFDGNTVWKKSFGGRLEGSFSKVIVLSDGSVAAAGQVTDTLTQKTDIFVAKINADGTNPVDAIYSYSGNQTSEDMLQTSEGFIILGTTDAERTSLTDSTGNKAGKTDILILRIFDNLNKIDEPAPLGFPDNDEGVAIKPDIGGGFIIAGTTQRYLNKGHKNDLFLWRINAVGISTQPSFIGGTDDEYAADLEVLNDGYLIAGTIGTVSETQSVLITKIPRDIYNDPIFSQNIKKTTSWSIKALSRYKTSSFVLAGKEGASSQSKMLIFVIDADGNPVKGKERISGSTGVQLAANDVVTDNESNIIIVGTNTFESNSMITLLKFGF